MPGLMVKGRARTIGGRARRKEYGARCGCCGGCDCSIDNISTDGPKHYACGVFASFGTEPCAYMRTGASVEHQSTATWYTFDFESGEQVKFMELSASGTANASGSDIAWTRKTYNPDGSLAKFESGTATDLPFLPCNPSSGGGNFGGSYYWPLDTVEIAPGNRVSLAPYFFEYRAAVYDITFACNTMSFSGRSFVGTHEGCPDDEIVLIAQGTNTVTPGCGDDPARPSGPVGIGPGGLL